jgi:putative membrane protein
MYIPPQTGNVSWQHIIMLSSSVIPKIYIPVLIFTFWALALKIFYNCFKEKEFINHIFFPSSLLTYLGLVLSLLLVFRNTSAYDRFWEGRKAWANILNQSRNLSRHIWISVEVSEDDKLKDEKLNLKRGEMRLIIALVISIRHALRGEYGWDYDDLAELVQHVPRFNSLITTAPKKLLKILPLEIAYHIQGYIYQQKQLPPTVITPVYNSISSIIDSFTTCERILYTPIPLIYGIHIKHALIIYLLTLPLQIIPTCGWASVLILLLTSFIFFGIEAISSEIENPFGSDMNDLKLDEFCQQINDEISGMMKYFPSSIGFLDWLECEDIEETETDVETTTATNDSSTFTVNISEKEEGDIPSVRVVNPLGRFGSSHSLSPELRYGSATTLTPLSQDTRYGSSSTLNTTVNYPLKNKRNRTSLNKNNMGYHGSSGMEGEDDGGNGGHDGGCDGGNDGGDC